MGSTVEFGSSTVGAGPVLQANERAAHRPPKSRETVSPETAPCMLYPAVLKPLKSTGDGRQEECRDLEAAPGLGDGGH